MIVTELSRKGLWLASSRWGGRMGLASTGNDRNECPFPLNLSHEACGGRMRGR